MKLDLYKLHKNDYAAPKTPVLLKIKPAAYLAVSGQGAPGGDDFTAAIGALYGMAFTIKMTRKFAGLRDYAVCKLECQCRADGKEADFANTPKDQWRWKLLIRSPGFIKEKDLAQAVDVLLKRGKPADVKRVRLETIKEGTCVQMLHLGPYDKEGATIARMKDFAGQHDLQFHGLHHEIYLSDPRRVPPDRLKTILRQPVA